jgi:hypothetical protein
MYVLSWQGLRPLGGALVASTNRAADLIVKDPKDSETGKVFSILPCKNGARMDSILVSYFQANLTQLNTVGVVYSSTIQCYSDMYANVRNISSSVMTGLLQTLSQERPHQEWTSNLQA